MPFGQAGLSYFCLSLIAGGNNQNVLAKKKNCSILQGFESGQLWNRI